MNKKSLISLSLLLNINQTNININIQDFFYQQRINKIKRDISGVSQPLYKTPNTSIPVPYQLMIQQYTIPVQNIRTQQTQLHQPTKKVTPSNKDIQTR